MICNPIKPGDTVRHGPSKEKWTVAAVNHKEGRLSPAGWPETIAEISDCTLVSSAPSEESRAMIDECLKLPITDIRRRWNEPKEQP